MLAVAWDALDSAIPRLQADERYAAYLVAIAASPHAGKDGQKLASSWREMATHGLEGIETVVRAGVTAGSNSIKQLRETPFVEIMQKVREAFGAAIRD